MEFFKRHPLLSGFFILTTIIVLAVLIVRANQSAKELSERALRNLGRGFYDQAWSDVTRSLQIDPNNEEALIIAAAISIHEDEFDRAREFYDRIDTPRLLDLHTQLIDSCLSKEQVEMAEKALLGVLERRPDHPRAVEQLLSVYRMTGRRWEHRKFLVTTLGYREPPLEDAHFLFYLPNITDPGNMNLVDTAFDLHHSEPAVRLAACLNNLDRGNAVEARAALNQLVIEYPDFLEARAQLGLALLKRGDSDALRQWAHNLPEDALTHPDVCYVVGSVLEEAGDTAGAIAFHRHALLLDYRHHEALLHLINLLEEPPADVLEQLNSIANDEEEIIVVTESLLRSETTRFEPEKGVAGLALLERMGWLPEAKVWGVMFTGDESREVAVGEERVDERLAASADVDPAERDWPAIEPLIRSLNIGNPTADDLWEILQGAFQAE